MGDIRRAGPHEPSTPPWQIDFLRHLCSVVFSLPPCFCLCFLSPSFPSYTSQPLRLISVKFDPPHFVCFYLSLSVALSACHISFFLSLSLCMFLKCISDEYNVIMCRSPFITLSHFTLSFSLSLPSTHISPSLAGGQSAAPGSACNTTSLSHFPPEPPTCTCTSLKRHPLISFFVLSMSPPPPILPLFSPVPDMGFGHLSALLTSPHNDLS